MVALLAEMDSAVEDSTPDLTEEVCEIKIVDKIECLEWIMQSELNWPYIEKSG